jgi:phosphatidylglycerophosphate synthase
MRCGVTANQVTVASGFVALLSLFLFLLGGPGGAFWGAALLVFFSLLDCVDGNIARVRPARGPAVGKFLDQCMVHLYNLSFFCLAWGWRWEAVTFTRHELLAFGAVASLSKYVAALTGSMFWQCLGDSWTARPSDGVTTPPPRRLLAKVYYNLTDPQALVALWPAVVLAGGVEGFLLLQAVVGLAQGGVVLAFYFHRAWRMREP